MNVITNLDFGRESAESEQPFLRRVFLPTPVFERIRRGQKQLVLGRKGSGKTAVCLSLYENLKDQGMHVSLITPRDLSKFKMSLLEKGSLNTAESSLLSWKYVFLTELGEYILQIAEKDYGGNYLSWPEHFKRIRKFMAENIAKHASWMDKTFKVIRAIKKIGVAQVQAEVDTTAVYEDVADFTDKLDEIIEDIVEVLSSSDKRIYILIDQVDELWEPSKESHALIVGLLRAGKELHEQFAAVNVVTFLRSDIFDALQFHDSDKFHSFEERIVWEKKDLKSLLTLRARTSTGLSGKRDAIDKIWLTFFPPEVNGEDSFEYLLQYTLMRPRELIQLCNLCRDKAHNHHHNKITADDIGEALQQYSKWKLRDLRDEYIVQYPFLERIFLSVFQHSRSHLTTDEIVERFAPVKEYLLKEYERFYFDPITNLLQTLYYIGFLGAVKDRRVLYSSVGDDVIIPYIKEFEIHPAFRLALDIRSTTAQKTSNKTNESNMMTGSQAVVTSDSNIQIGGVANVGTIVFQSERELYELLHEFKGQLVPGRIFNLDSIVELPIFARISREHNIPEADVKLNILAIGEQSWAIELKYRDLQSSDLHQAASHAIAAKAKSWIVSFNPIPQKIRDIARNLGVMITGPDELGELRKCLKTSEN